MPHAYDRNWSDRSRDARRKHGARCSPNVHHYDNLAQYDYDEDRWKVLGWRDQTGTQLDAEHEQRQQHNERE